MLLKVNDVPFLKECPKDGRIHPLMTYFDGNEWHKYYPQPDNSIFDFKIVDVVSGLYLAKEAQAKSDFEFPLLTFIFQYFPTQETFSAFEVIQADLENSLACVHKQFLLFDYFKESADGTHAAVISTELEYALLNHRSAFDLFNKLVIAFLKRHNFLKATIPGGATFFL